MGQSPSIVQSLPLSIELNRTFDFSLSALLSFSDCILPAGNELFAGLIDTQSPLKKGFPIPVSDCYSVNNHEQIV